MYVFLEFSVTRRIISVKFILSLATSANRKHPLHRNVDDHVKHAMCLTGQQLKLFRAVSVTNES